jgi:hypothetical protein
MNGGHRHGKELTHMLRAVSRKRLGWFLPALVLLILLVHERHALLAALVPYSEFEHIDGVYFSPHISVNERRRVLGQLDLARGRVEEFYGSLRGRPTIIIADAHTLPRFTDNSVAVTHYLPTAAVSVFGPAGQTADVLAHELAHAELFARVGYRAIAWCVPTWFDEGLAVQFDDRPFYGPLALQQRREEGWRLPAMIQLARRRQFFAGSRDLVRFHYAAARAVVGRWIRKLGQAEGLHQIEEIDCGGRWHKEVVRIAGPAE